MLKRMTQIPQIFIEKTQYPQFNQLIPLLKSLNIEIHPLNQDTELKLTSLAHIKISEEVGVVIMDENCYPHNSYQLRQLKEQLSIFCNLYQNTFILGENFDHAIQAIPDIFRSSFQGLLLLLEIENHTGIIPFDRLEDGATMISSLATRIQIEDNPPKMTREKPKRSTLKSAQEYFVSGLYNVGPQKSKTLLNHFENPKTIIEQIQQKFNQKTTQKSCASSKPDIFADLKGFGSEFVLQNGALLFKKF